jgi:hypothetical protein
MVVSENATLNEPNKRKHIAVAGDIKYNRCIKATKHRHSIHIPGGMNFCRVSQTNSFSPLIIQFRRFLINIH